MRAAPLKGDCLICQAPPAIRDAINRAIWPDEGTSRATDYRAAAQKVGKESRVPDLETLDRKTITRHAEHIEAAWRVVGPGEDLRDGEVPVAFDFGTLMDSGSRVGVKALGILERALDELGPAAFAYYPKETIAIAKLGVVASSTKEASRLKRNQQVIDVMAIFAAGSGHLPSSGSAADENDVELDVMRAEVAAERRLLEARASGSTDDASGEVLDDASPAAVDDESDDLPPDVLAAAVGDA